MFRNQKGSSTSGALMVLLLFINAIVLKENAMSSGESYWLLWFTIPLLLITILRFRREAAKR